MQPVFATGCQSSWRKAGVRYRLIVRQSANSASVQVMVLLVVMSVPRR